MKSSVETRTMARSAPLEAVSEDTHGGTNLFHLTDCFPEKSGQAVVPPRNDDHFTCFAISWNVYIKEWNSWDMRSSSSWPCGLGCTLGDTVGVVPVIGGESGRSGGE